MAAVVETKRSERERWWRQTQTNILKHFIHLFPDTAKIVPYDGYSMCGAYIEVELESHIVEIEIEDVTTMDEFLKNKVVEITIREKPDEDEDEWGGGRKFGYLETMEEAGRFVNLIQYGKMDDAFGMLEKLRSW